MNIHDRPKLIDLFSGAGGMSLGFEQAGFDVLAAVELDPVHACIHHFNFPYSKTICANISDLDGLELLEKANVSQKSQVDLIIGGAPCQGFSIIGQRAIDDPRNSLLKDYLRILGQIKPKAFVFENVKGLTLGSHIQLLNEFLDEVSALDYNVVLPWRVLNSNNYGVPQSRERLIIIGYLNTLENNFAYPEITSNPHPHVNDLFTKPTPTCEDALDDLPNVDLFSELESNDSVSIELPLPNSAYAKIMRMLSADSWKYGHIRVWDPSILTSSMQTKHTEISIRRFLEAPEGKPEEISRLFKLPRKGQSNTLRAGTDSSRGAFSSPRPIHYKFGRVITVREMARLHGFPDWFRFHVTKWHGARQIGNAVPPLLAYHIGLNVMKGIGKIPEKSNHSIQLGNPELLKLTLEEACSYWGVRNPIGKRNMKSGAKKRKQEEIERERLAL